MEKSIWSSEGRISMKTYWILWSICLGIDYVLGVISVALGEVGNVIIFLPILIVVCFRIVQGVKRMHDVNKSSWFFFLIPIYRLILLLTPGTAGPNRFDP